MAAITKRLLHLRPNLHSYPRPHLYPLHHFSSSSDPDPPADIPQSEPVGEPDSSVETQTKSSFFDDIKASLQREPPPQDRQQTFRKPFSFSNRTRQTPPPSKEASFEEIRRNISEFRLRSAAPPPSSSSGQYVSMQELYKKNVLSMTDDSATSSDSLAEKPSTRPEGGTLSYNGIRESLSNLKANINDSGGNAVDRISLARFKETLKLKPDPNANLGSTRIIGGSDSFPPNFLGKERRVNGVYNLGSTGSMMLGFLKMSDHLDLGKKLKMLRPEKRKGKWFSLQELSERLAKVRKIEEKESEARIGIPPKVLRDSIQKMSPSNDDKSRPRMMHRIDFLGQVGGTPSIMLLPDAPPKANLVEKYFHPDNMSSAEKLKLELKRVRDEFKMSESDCGSARVQVAQLTTKIKHLSNVLQKKDKHSRRGLQAMVQRRKKLLKYLRRTDWDSYCVVISKLGLRDNPDVKA
ncbi:Mitochondrial/choloroplast ribosomal protein S15 [Handroanthus impetiginosus]|uniref:Small ribosomal subunit protein uS15c n=1 Tax=Handroanthus impetiginosus TaxID=429701 RepID=A0A2G9HMC4_9LAMI|nr:Mitochondrial/choloroplast ribosomal protein S15 [Handroanthus impetiginosus]